ncbi:MAG: peptide chain release factor 1 [Bacteroidetes bacterium MED-G17]|nr:MAG: peptide chain release factor 1 [Bacteroidetes bacterium TMED39]PDH52622.1 MAG: peptide chain release factor 1 [Bacteroidetes bacterium MED-G17]CAI8278464.1 MAG: Peptide chain release factor RF1 [Bacteroidetes bacterium MED-G17]|tara:strand:+ start:34975 stop:36051 length:1077 start_codon:yes stop_codon:yes gene_type:complete
MIEKLEAIHARYLELEQLLSSPEIAANVEKFTKFNKEYSDLKEIVHVYFKYNDVLSNSQEAEQILSEESDAELKQMAKDELAELREEKQNLEEKIKILLIPKDPEDDKKAIIEIRSGTGGDEASLFAGDLFKMYEKFCANKKWSIEVVDSLEGTAGGFNKIIFNVNQPGVYGTLKFESGVHRVQRVPDTESQGRVHTSAATVAVLPEAEEVDVKIDMKDVRRDTFRASGAGGQHVNKTESAVRLTHIPSGIVAECQDGRSQHANYDKALKMLRSRIYEKELEHVQNQRALQRKSLVSTGDRSAKIRTYNFPQSRITDHRINLTLYNLNEVLNGDLDQIIERLQMAENAEKMKGENSVN